MFVLTIYLSQVGCASFVLAAMIAVSVLRNDSKKALAINAFLR
jgi:3-oxoacyl-[acyl-carrier-protein] synthase III